MRTFVMTEGGLLFEMLPALPQQTTEEAPAETCFCPPDICLGQEASMPAMFGLIDPTLSGDLDLSNDVDLIDEEEEDDEDEFEIVFEPDFELEPEVLAPQEQLDQLGEIVHSLTMITGMYAAMVADERSEADAD